MSASPCSHSLVNPRHIIFYLFSFQHLSCFPFVSQQARVRDKNTLQENKRRQQNKSSRRNNLGGFSPVKDEEIEEVVNGDEEEDLPERSDTINSCCCYHFLCLHKIIFTLFSLFSNLLFLFCFF